MNWGLAVVISLAFSASVLYGVHRLLLWKDGQEYPCDICDVCGGPFPIGGSCCGRED